MGIVPTHELGSRMGTWEILAGDIEFTISLRANSINHSMIMVKNIVMCHIRTKFHIAKEAKPGTGGNSLIGLRYRLDLLVIGSNTPTNQTIRRGQAVKHIDLDNHISLFL